MPEDTTAELIFPLPYNSEVTAQQQIATREVKFESGKKQVQQLSINPQLTWTINCRGTIDELKKLRAFFEQVGGNTKTFSFIDELGIRRTCRFATNSLSEKVIRDFSSTSETKGIPVGFTASIEIENVL